MKMCDLPKDMAEEVLCRIPVTSLRPIRSTCKKWNKLSKCGLFAKKHLAHQAKVAEEEAKEGRLVVMMMDYRVFLMRFNLSNKSCVVEREARLIGPDGSDQLDVCGIFHCDGLLLCIPKDHSRLVVWNPYWGQTRWIEHTHNCRLVDKHRCSYTYALGYDRNSKSHKVLRVIDFLSHFVEFKIYDFSSDSWRIILDLFPRTWMIRYGERGLSLKGNTYWFAAYRQSTNGFLVCFDFTRETFGPPLSLPRVASFQDTVSLSSVREDQLVVLFQTLTILTFEIWISTKIGDDPNAVSWNNKFFLSANIKQLIHPQWQFPASACFFIAEDNKVAVVFDKDTDIQNPTREVAYIIGVDGSLKEAADVRECADRHCGAFLCSYVPSLVQLN
ncbi:putative F-box protein At3g23420 [Brassica rapa]|uniref:putative F-box protein At3g23420 n=1 Tax=Brassica campestris TaxID=3711 RepID=UPI0004F17292|nr:putative F-box protein At3g23420 [Brassica rapa]XP_013665444.2 putative F-box protein At3g23420 [Brassica napus]